jgi:hypothetical protein
VNRRPRWVVLLTFGGLLAACSSPSAPGVLTSTDIPSYLDVKANPSATVDYAGRLSPPHRCTTVGVAVFSVPSQPLNMSILPTSAQTRVVTTARISCANVSEARASFGTAAGVSVSGIGDEAQWLNEGVAGGGRFYAIIWRKNNQLGNVSVAGPKDDSRIGPGLTELLARRAVARVQ